MATKFQHTSEVWKFRSQEIFVLQRNKLKLMRFPSLFMR